MSDFAEPLAVSEEDRDSGLEPLEEVEFELLLSSIDLSSLEQWDKGPAGAAEADATRSEAEAASAFLADTRGDEESLARSEAEELSLSSESVENDEEPAKMEELESLPLAEPESLAGREDAAGAAISFEPEGEAPGDSDTDILVDAEKAEEEAGGGASDLDRYLGPWIAYRPFAAFDRGRVLEELLVVGDGQPWEEVEFLGEEEEEIFDGAEGGIIEYRDGVFRLNTDLALSGSESSTGASGEDSEMRALVDSVLGSDAEPGSSSAEAP